VTEGFLDKGQGFSNVPIRLDRVNMVYSAGYVITPSDLLVSQVF
jgi:hypothetical protein